MNHKTRYELTITDKLQDLPLPGLEDAIWARVKTQLDLDLPTDDPGDGGPDAPTGGSGWIWGTGLFMLVAALVTVFFFRKNDLSPTQTLPSNTIQTAAPLTTPTEQQTTASPAPFPQQQKNPPPAPAGLSPGTVVVPRADSIAAVPTTALPLPDSQALTSILQPPPAQADTSNNRPKPKTRGVRGLTDDDYRIVPAKKDSL